MHLHLNVCLIRVLLIPIPQLLYSSLALFGSDVLAAQEGQGVPDIQEVAGLGGVKISAFWGGQVLLSCMKPCWCRCPARR